MKPVFPGELAPAGEDIRKGCTKMNMAKIYIYILMYENGRMRPVEIIPGMEGEGDKRE
jgi:hypothetical protein